MSGSSASWWAAPSGAVEASSYAWAAAAAAGAGSTSAGSSSASGASTPSSGTAPQLSPAAAGAAAAAQAYAQLYPYTYYASLGMYSPWVAQQANYAALAAAPGNPPSSSALPVSSAPASAPASSPAPAGGTAAPSPSPTPGSSGVTMSLSPAAAKKKKSRFQPKPAVAPQPAPSTPAAGATWPESLVAYVEKSLSTCPPAKKPQTEAYLKRRIEGAIAAGRLFSINWASEPLAYIAAEYEAQQLAKPRQQQQQHEAKAKFEAAVRAAAAIKPSATAAAAAASVPTRKDEFGRDVPISLSESVSRKRRDPPESEEYVPLDGRQSKKARKAAARAAKAAAKAAKPKVKAKGGVAAMALAVDEFRKGQRAQRFGLNDDGVVSRRNRMAGVAGMDDGDDMDFDVSGVSIVGTSESLEKPYLRLTSAPDPSTVRPERVLRKALERLRQKWAQGAADYAYICEQFKSMRQDMTVQRIKNRFTVDVYETHARIALQVRDLSEYNQCQTQLKHLYRDDASVCENANEFTAYRILYALATANQASIMHMLKTELPPALRANPLIAFALNIRAAVAADNYHRFFALCADPPLQVSLLDMLIDRMRFRALEMIARAYRPMQLDISFLQSTLSLEDTAATVRYIRSCNGKVSADGKLFITSESEVQKPAPGSSVSTHVVHAVDVD